METRKIILSELNEISPAVADLGNENVFTVPQGYFDEFPAAVLSLIRCETIRFGEKNHPFQVPVNYFDSLAGNIFAKINQQEQTVEEELNELAPLLNSISKQPVYAVPEGYFQSLELIIPLKLAKPSAKLFRFSNTKRVLQFAVAACTVGVLAIGAYLYNNNNTGVYEAQISYTEAVNMNVASELDQLNETDIASYLAETPNIGYALNVSAEEIDIDEYIDETSDEEINEYLNETPVPAVNSNTGI